MRILLRKVKGRMWLRGEWSGVTARDLYEVLMLADGGLELTRSQQDVLGIWSEVSVEVEDWEAVDAFLRERHGVGLHGLEAANQRVITSLVEKEKEREWDRLKYQVPRRPVDPPMAGRIPGEPISSLPNKPPTT